MEGSAYSKPSKKVSKRRIELEKRVLKVKIGANTDQTQKSQFPPSDSWSWRKYGQKPIKGTPYPRGYYKCTTSKGCLAKKQVERSKDDASMLIITYTSDHNHPTSPVNQAHQKHQPKSPAQAQPPPQILPVTKAGDDENSAEKGDHVEEEPYVVTLENKCFQDEVEEEKTVSWSEFFDELGELPHTSTSTSTISASSSSFTSFMKNYFFDERMLVPHP